jgi:Secretion system C-terminal sorting domain/NHL repeat
MDAAGNVTTIAGSGAWTFQDGPVLQAAFKEPKSLVVDNASVVYVADYENHCVRKIDNGQVTTIAGAGGVAGDAIGSASNARFHRPRDLTIDAAGNIYVVDLINHKVKKISTGGQVTLLAGSGIAGGTDGTGAAASFNIPVAIDWFPNGDLCVLDAIGIKIRRVTTAGVVTTIAGSGVSGYVDGPVMSASFNLPQDICFDPTGNLYVGDDNNHVIRVLLSDVNPKGIQENRTVELLTVYPNPAQDELTVTIPTDFKAKAISVLDENGRLCMRLTINNPTEKLTLSTNRLASGKYFILLEGKDETKATGSFLKQ